MSGPGCWWPRTSRWSSACWPAATPWFPRCSRPHGWKNWNRNCVRDRKWNFPFTSLNRRYWKPSRAINCIKARWPWQKSRRCRILKRCSNNSPRPLLLAAVEGIASAENLGAVVRSCAAFGAHFLIVGETCGSPFQRRAVAGSMGTIFEQPLVRVDDLVETLKSLRTRGVRCLAAHPSPGAKKLSGMDLRDDCCLVFGAEGPGLTAVRAGGVR